MSEKLNPEVDQSVDQGLEDDPLAELARIVAGEPEPVLETNALEPEVSVEAEPVQYEEVLEAIMAEPEPFVDLEPVVSVEPVRETLPEPSISDLDMEAALSEALGDPMPEAQPIVEFEAPAVEQELSARDEITRAVDQVVNEQPEPFTVDESVLQTPAAELPEPGLAVDQAPSFEDGLISALETELTPEPMQETIAVEALNDPVAEVVNTAEAAAVEFPEQEEVVGSEEFTSLENALAAELDDEMAVGFEAVDETMQSVSDQPALEPGYEVPSEVEHPQPAEEDLGAAFANEFEQMMSQDTQMQEVPAETEFVQADPLETFADDLAAPLAAGAAAVAGTAAAVAEPKTLDDLDFGSAFAEELGVEKLDEVGGWETGSTEAAQAEFSDALQPQEFASEFEDPGHSGQIPGVPDEAAMHPEAAQQKGGSSLKYAMAALIIALFAGTIFAGYGFLGGDSAGEGGEPKLIKAETDPIKQKPDDPGGRVVANQDKASYEKVEGTDGDNLAQESLISKTEEPAEIVSTGVNDGATVETNLTPKADERLSGGGEEDTASAAATTGEVAPRVVQTVTVKPDGTIVQSAPSVPKIAETVTSAATELASSALSSVEDAQVTLVEPKPVTTELIKKPEPIDGAKTTGTTAVPVASPLPKPVVKQKPKPVQTAAVKPKPAAPAAVRRSEWVVQVSSQRTPEAAQSSFTNLRNRFSVLQGRPMSVQRANVNGATFYRVRVQTSSRNDANQLCSRLQAAGGSCFVTR